MSRHLQTLFLLAVLSFLFVIPTQAQVTTSQYEWNSYVSR